MSNSKPLMILVMLTSKLA